MKLVTGLYRLKILAFLLALSAIAHSAIPVDLSDTVTMSVTPEILKAKIEETESTSELAEGTRARLVELYRKATSLLEMVIAHNHKAEAFRQARKSASQRAANIREQQVKKQKDSPADANN